MNLQGFARNVNADKSIFVLGLAGIGSPRIVMQHEVSFQLK